MTRVLILSIVALALILTVRGEAAPRESPPFPLPLRFDVGSDHPSQDHRGRLYLTDQEWTPETRAGYVGGYRVWNGPEHPVDGTPDPFLHTNQRHDWEEYRFSDLPDGDYLVTLTFSEIGIPAYTVFDVTIEGRIVLHNFRIYDHVGGNYALTRRFATWVTDGELNVASREVIGDPRLAAIEIEARSPDRAAPAAPTGLVTTGSYDAVLLDWIDSPDGDLDGYHVYRAPTPEGPHTRLTAEPAHVSRYRDADARPHTPYHYCVSAVDVYGNESGPSDCRPGHALDESDATLPLYKLEIPPQNLRYLYTHALSDEEVSASFTYRGETYPVLVRYRGGYGRFVHKKPWKIKFPSGSPFPGRSEINLRADYIDHTLMRTRLATALFESVGVPVPQARHVLLMLNGEYWGVYTENEQVDEGFLERTGRDPDARIYKALDTDFHDFTRAQPSAEAYRRAYDKKAPPDADYGDLIAFIELINRAPEERFAEELGRVFDVATYLDFYAVTVLISNGDFVHHNAYLLRDPDTDRWTLVPYDFDVTFRMPERPINEGTAASPIQPRGWQSVLLTRVLDVPRFHASYCRRLAELMDTTFSDEAMAAQIDETYAAIEQDGLRDWQKYHREENTWFLAAPDELKSYVQERREFLQGEMAGYCPADGDPLDVPPPGGSDALRPPTIGGMTHAPALPTHLDAVTVTATITDDGALLSPTLHYSATGSDLARQPMTALGGELYAARIPPQPANTQVQYHVSATDDDGRERVTASQSYLVGYRPPSLFINEFLADNASTFCAAAACPDWIELYNPGPDPVELSGRYLTDDLGDPTRFRIPDGLTLPAGGFALFYADNRPEEGPFHTNFLLDRDGESVGLFDRDATGNQLLDIHTFGFQATDRSVGRCPGSDRWGFLTAPTPGTANGQCSAPPSAPAGYEPPPLLINELMAANDTTLEDPDDPGDFPDWIELYNAGPTPLELGGLHLTDDLADPTRFRIPDGLTIPAGGFALFYADGDPEQGPFHTGLRLRQEGETIGLFDRDEASNAPIDTHTFGPQAIDVSEGRRPDGGDTWATTDMPTPGRPAFEGSRPYLPAVLKGTTR